MKKFLRGLSLAALVASPAADVAAQQSYADSNYYSQSASDDSYADNEVAQVSAAAYVGDEDTVQTMAQAPQMQTAVARTNGSPYQTLAFVGTKPVQATLVAVTAAAAAVAIAAVPHEADTRTDVRSLPRGLGKPQKPCCGSHKLALACVSLF